MNTNLAEILNDALRALANGAFEECRDCLHLYTQLRDIGEPEPLHGDLKAQHIQHTLYAFTLT